MIYNSKVINIQKAYFTLKFHFFFLSCFILYFVYIPENVTPTKHNAFSLTQYELEYFILNRWNRNSVPADNSYGSIDSFGTDDATMRYLSAGTALHVETGMTSGSHHFTDAARTFYSPKPHVTGYPPIT